MMRGHFDEIKNILSIKRKINFPRTNNRGEERLFGFWTLFELVISNFLENFVTFFSRKLYSIL